MSQRRCDPLISDNWAYSPVTQAVNLPMKDQLRFDQKEYMLKLEAFNTPTIKKLQ